MSGVDDIQATLPTAGESVRRQEPDEAKASRYVARHATGDDLRTFLQMLGIEPSDPPRKERRKWH